MMLYRKLIIILCGFGTITKTGEVHYQTIFSTIGHVGSIVSLLGWAPPALKTFFQEYSNINQALLGRVLLDALHAVTLGEMLNNEHENNVKPNKQLLTLNVLGTVGSMTLWLKGGKYLYDKKLLDKKYCLLLGSRMILDAIIFGVTTGQLFS